jgi:hypothetical protein
VTSVTLNLQVLIQKLFQTKIQWREVIPLIFILNTFLSFFISNILNSIFKIPNVSLTLENPQNHQATLPNKITQWYHQPWKNIWKQFMKRKFKISNLVLVQEFYRTHGDHHCVHL